MTAPRPMAVVDGSGKVAFDDASHNLDAGGQRRFVYVEARRVVRMRQAARLVARAKKEITAGHALQKVTHVFAAHRAHAVVTDDLLAPDDFGGAVCDQLADCGVVDERQRLPFVIQRVARAHRIADATHDALEHFWDARVSLFAEGARGAAQLNRAGDDVEGRAAGNFAYSDDRGVERRDVAADDGLQSADDLGGDDNGINRLLRHRAVTAAPFDHQSELVNCGHHRPGIDADGSGGKVIPDVQ